MHGSRSCEGNWTKDNMATYLVINCELEAPPHTTEHDYHLCWSERHGVSLFVNSLQGKEQCDPKDIVHYDEQACQEENGEEACLLEFAITRNVPDQRCNFLHGRPERYVNWIHSFARGIGNFDRCRSNGLRDEGLFE